jgi:endonuclease/exonuclease/phosphatase family metal-dependent hydrolase
VVPRRDKLRIVSYNIHACVGRDRRFMPERIADVMESLDADFYALQEVEDRPFGGQPVSCYFAARLGMQLHRGATLRRQEADYGNLLLARHNTRTLTLHDISVPGGEPRGCIEADFSIGSTRLRLFATHLGLRASERLQQVRLLRPALDRDDADIKILAGDINEWRPTCRVLRALHGIFARMPQRRTFPSNLPAVALDRIYVEPREAVAEMRVASSPKSRIASDHLPLVCDISLPSA